MEAKSKNARVYEISAHDKDPQVVKINPEPDPLRRASSPALRRRVKRAHNQSINGEATEAATRINIKIAAVADLRNVYTLGDNLRTTKVARAPHYRSRLLLRVVQKVPYCEYFERDTSRFRDFLHRFLQQVQKD